jgi:hypothetical protein
LPPGAARCLPTSRGWEAGLELAGGIFWADLDALAGRGWPESEIEILHQILRSAAGAPVDASTVVFRTGCRDALVMAWAEANVPAREPYLAEAGAAKAN